MQFPARDTQWHASSRLSALLSMQLETRLTRSTILPEVTHASILGLPLRLSWERVCLQCGRPGFNPWVGKTPWRRERLSTPVFWSGEFHELDSLWGHKESDTTERLPLFPSRWPSMAFWTEPQKGHSDTGKVSLVQSSSFCFVFQFLLLKLWLSYKSGI